MKKVLSVTILLLSLLLWCGVSNATLPATDNFDRTASLPLSGSWATAGTLSQMQGANNHAYGTGADSAAYWTGDTFANDQYSQVAIYGIYQGVVLRGGATNCYFVIEYGDHVAIYKSLAGVLTHLGDITFTLANGDTLRANIVGTTIEVFLNGVSKGTQAAGSDIASGSAGIYAYGSGNGYVDDWEGGNVGAGGTVYNSSITLAQVSGIANSIYNTALGSYLLSQISGYSGSSLRTSFPTETLAQISGYLGSGIEAILLSETLAQASGYSTFGGNVYVSTETLAQVSNFTDSVLRTVASSLSMAQSSGLLNSNIGQIQGSVAMAQKSGLVQSPLLSLMVSNALAQKSGYSSMGGNQYFLTETLAQLSSFSDNSLLLALLSEALSSASLYASGSSVVHVINQYFFVLTLNGMSFIIGNGSTWRSPVSPIVLIHPEELRSIIHPVEDRVLRVMP